MVVDMGIKIPGILYGVTTENTLSKLIIKHCITKQREPNKANRIERDEKRTTEKK
jgi:hypothetical protein